MEPDSPQNEIIPVDDPPTSKLSRPVLRAFQHRTKAQVRELFTRKGDAKVRRVLVVAPTGAGKGTLAVDFILDAIARGWVTLFCVHRAEIIDDIVARLGRCGCVGVNVIRGNDPRRFPNSMVHVASIDSLRTHVLPKAKFLIVDEAHRSLSASYMNLLEKYPDVFVVGFTGTPVRLDKKPLSIVYEELVVAAQPSELLANDPPLLAKARVFSVDDSHKPDVSGIALRGGDFDQEALGEVMMAPKLVGSIPEHILSHAPDLAGVAFCVTVKHSMAVARACIEAGIPAEHIDGEATVHERRALMARIRSGETRIVCCCALWLEGIDLPELKVCILARPTKSITIFLQGCGRVFRPWLSMHAIVLDHAGNVQRFGLPQADREWSIKPIARKSKKGSSEPAVKTCQCGAMMPPSTMTCPECGHVFPVKELEHIDGNLIEVTEARVAAIANDKKQAAFTRLWMAAYRDGFDKWWVMRRYAEKFGDAPDENWVPPPRPVVVYSREQKFAELTKLQGIAHRQNRPYSWVEEKFLAKIGESVKSLRAAVKTVESEAPKNASVTDTTIELVDLEF